jgi:hypothetical protein
MGMFHVVIRLGLQANVELLYVVKFSSFKICWTYSLKWRTLKFFLYSISVLFFNFEAEVRDCPSGSLLEGVYTKVMIESVKLGFKWVEIGNWSVLLHDYNVNQNVQVNQSWYFCILKRYESSWVSKLVFTLVKG